MASYISLPEGYRLEWTATCLTAQRQVERTKRKTQEIYRDWEDLGYYGPTYRGLTQATERVIGHYLSTHGETDCESLTRSLRAFAAEVEKAMSQAKLAA